MRLKDRHMWFWIVVYDVPQSTRKKFYRNLNELKKKIKLEYVTRSVIRVRCLRDAAAIYLLVGKCGGEGDLFAAFDTIVHTKGLARITGESYKRVVIRSTTKT